MKKGCDSKRLRKKNPFRYVVFKKIAKKENILPVNKNLLLLFILYKETFCILAHPSPHLETYFIETTY